MKHLVSIFVTIFFSSLTFSTSFVPPQSTKDLSEKLQRFAFINNSEETYISLFARPSITFSLVKKVDSAPSLRIQNFDLNCLNAPWIDGKNIKIEFLFDTGPTILIKNGKNYKGFEISSNCGEYGPMNVYQKAGEMYINTVTDLMNLCSKQYKKINENYEGVEVRIQTSVKCGFFMIFGEDTYISDISKSNVKLPSDKVAVKSNTDVPESFKNYLSFNETAEEVEMNLNKVLPDKIEFVGDNYFGIPSFHFNYGKRCGSILTYLQFFNNSKCMATVYLTSRGNSVIETTYGSLTIPKQELPKTKFFADLGMIYSVLESDYIPVYKNLLLCEIYPNEALPYFNITKVQSISKCKKPKIIFGGSLADNITMALPAEPAAKKEAESPWLASLPYVAIVCLILLLIIAAFLVYFCVRRRRKNQKRKLEGLKQKDEQKLVSKLPTVEEEKELEPNTLSQIIEKELEENEVEPKPQPFKVIVPDVNENISSTKPLSPPANEKHK